MLKKILFLLLLFLVSNVVFAATNTYIGAIGGNWNVATNWSLGAIPTMADDVVIASGKTVVLGTNVSANSINVSGTLNVSFKADITINSQLIVVTSPNGTINFDHSIIRLPSNVGLYLQNGSNSLNGSCNNNDEIFVGTVQYAVCTGGGALYLFQDIENAGGINLVSSGVVGTAQAICSGATPVALTSTTAGTGQGTITYEWQTNASGSYVTISGATSATYSPPTLTATTSYQRRTISVFGAYTFYSAYTTSITVTINPLPDNLTSSGFSGGSFCTGSQATLTFDAVDANGAPPYTLSYTDGTSTFSQNILTNAATTFNVAATTSKTYTLNSVTNANGCVNLSPSNKTASVTFRPTPTATLMGTTAVCLGATNPNIIFTNPQLAGVTITYTINGGANQTVNVVANNTTNVSVSTTTAGSFVYALASVVYSTNPTCTQTLTGSATVTVNALPNGPTIGTITQPTCALATGSVILSGLPSGGILNPGNTSYSGTSTTISNLSTGNYNFTVSNGTCTSLASGNVMINLQPLTPVKPILGIPTPLTCSISTGSVTITNYNAGYTYTVSPSTGVTVSGSTITAPVGSYMVTATIGSCTSLPSSGVTILPLVTNTYSGIWSAGSAPTSAAQNIVFNIGYTATTDLSGCSCTVNSGNVIINSGKTLTITNEIIVNVPGTLTFNDSASLFQINNVANIGNITYKRNYTGGEFDYTYWSSPVTRQNLLALSPSTKLDKFFSFNSTSNDWVQENPATATMANGKGYIIRGIPPPPGPPPGFGTNSFIGIPNNGNILMPVAFTNPLNLNPTDADYGVSYLLGNPYPSAIYADQFLYDNQSVINGTLYFWTHNTPIAIGSPDSGTGAWAYSGNDYASYNITGGVGTGSGTSALSGGVSPSGKIAAGQGFFVTSIATGTVNFTNTMRMDGSGNPLNNSNFYKTRSPKSKTANPIEKHRVWLNLTNTQGAFKQTLVGYITGATNAWDSLYDGESCDANDFLDFYSVNQDKNLTIQGRTLPFDENDEVPLGFRIAVEGTFSVAIGETDGLLAHQAVFLEDKLTNTVFNLKEGNYIFTTAVGTFNDRFILRYTDKTLGIEEVVLNDGIIVLYSNNYKTLIIRNNVKNANVNSVSLYNLAGQNIANWDVKGREQTSIQIPIKNLPAEIYIVKVKTTKGESSKKIIIK